MIKADNLKKQLSEFINIFLVLLFGLITYLYFEGLNWTGESAEQTLTDLNFFVESAALFFFDAGFIFYSFRYFKIKIRWPFFLVLIVMCLLAMIPIWGFPGSIYAGDVVYTIGSFLIFRYSVLTFMVFVSIFVFLFVIPQLFRNSGAFKLFLYISIGVGIVATIYSFINEADVYVALFTEPHPYHSVPQSYTTNRNIYAYICIIAMLSETKLLNEKDWPWHWVLLLYFFVNVFFTLSKTCIILALIIAIAFLAYKAIKNWKSHRAKSLIIIGISVAVISFNLIVSLINFDGLLGNVHLYTHFLFYELPKINEKSLDSRFYLFNVANDILSRSLFTRIFGYGYGNWYAAYYASYSGNYLLYNPMDVAYSVDMFQFGFAGLAFSIGLWGLAIYLVIMQFVNKSKHAFADALMLLCFLLRTVTEAGDLTFPNLTGTVYYLLLVCPMAVENNWFLSEKTEEKSNIFSNLKPTFDSLVLPVLSSISLIVSVILLCLSFLVNGSLFLILMIASILFMAIGIVSPVIVFVFYGRRYKADSKKLVQTILSSALTLIVWLIALGILTCNKANLDGMTYLMICLMTFVLALFVNGSNVIESLISKEKGTVPAAERSKSQF